MDDVERRARLLCEKENEIWDEAPASYRERWTREARSEEISRLRADLVAKTIECEMHVARAVAAEARNAKLRDDAEAAIREAAENMEYTATKRDGSPKLRFDIYEVRAAVRDVSEYYVSAVVAALSEGGEK